MGKPEPNIYFLVTVPQCSETGFFDTDVSTPKALAAVGGSIYIIGDSFPNGVR